MASVVAKVEKTGLSLHGLGVICGLTAGVWLGAAEAPTKLVNAGFSPFAISLCMVAGVFTARWTFPTLLKGTGYVFADLAQNFEFSATLEWNSVGQQFVKNHAKRVDLSFLVVTESRQQKFRCHPVHGARKFL